MTAGFSAFQFQLFAASGHNVTASFDDKNIIPCEASYEISLVIQD